MGDDDILGRTYGLRRGEITGLRWRNVDLEHNILKVVEQQPYDIDRDEVVLTEMAPPKSIEGVAYYRHYKAMVRKAASIVQEAKAFL